MNIKLTSLNPRWVPGTKCGAAGEAGPPGHRSVPPRRYGTGISFDCPLHVSLKSAFLSKHRIEIFFANPMDGLPPEDGVALWERGGSSFKTLSAFPAGDSHPECWHGSIKNGQIT